MSGFDFGDLAFLASLTVAGPPPSGTNVNFLGSSVVGGGFSPRNHTAPVSLSAGQKYFLVLADLTNVASSFGITVNGTAALQIVVSTQDDGARISVWEVTPAASGSAVSVTFTGGPQGTILGYFQVPNAAGALASIGSTATSGTSRTVSVNTLAGNAVISGMVSEGVTPTITWSGTTEVGTVDFTDGRRVSFAAVNNVAAETPRVITATSSDTNNNNGKAAVSVALG